jgi:hypothetical protein
MCSYHPDEGVNLVNGVLQNGVARPHLDIGFYNYGSLYFLLWQVAVAVNGAYGFVSVPPPTGSTVPATETLAAMILVGRLISAAMGVVTCLLLWWAGRLLDRPRAGWLSASLYAAAPIAAVHGHFATVDVTATALVTAALVAALFYVRRPSLVVAVAAGLLSGLAAATRYNAVLVILAPLAAVWIADSAASEKRTRRWARCHLSLYILGACCVGFLIGCPGALLNWHKFTHDLLFEAQKSSEGMGILFKDTGNGWIYHYFVSLRHGLGVPVLALITAGVICSAARPRKELLPPALFLVAYYVLMGSAQVRFARYMLPILPPLFLCSLDWLMKPRNSRGWRVGQWAIAAAVLLPGLHAAAAYSEHMSAPDARDVAAAYIRQNVASGTMIAFATTPWYWSPPLLPEFTAPVPGSVRRRLILETPCRFHLILPGENREWDVATLRQSNAPVVIVSDLESQDALRIRLPEALEYLSEAARARTPVRFGSRPRLFGIAATTEGYLPNDLLYVCPTVTVYVRKGAAR